MISQETVPNQAMKTSAWSKCGKVSLLLALLALPLMVACGDTKEPAGPGDDAGPDKDGDIGGDGKTFPKAVGEILVTKCGSCHQDGGIGTFPMDYEHAKPFAALIKSSTQARLMPPMPVNNDGTCQEYANARWLTDEELQIVADWVDDGAPSGDEEKEVDLPVLSTLENPDIVLEPPMPYTPMGTTGSPNDSYRCFPIYPGLSTDKYITGAEIVPGSKKVAHHMIVYLPPAQDQAWVAAEDAKSPDEEGYPCFGAVSPNQALPIVLWAPGSGRIDMPEGTGIKMPKDRVIVMQMHYNLAQGTEADQTKVKLRLEDSVAKEAIFFPLLDASFNIPAQKELQKTVPSGTDGTSGILALPVPLPAANLLTIYGVFPHMHKAGRTLNVKLSMDGMADQCLVDVDRWDFAWQEGWFYDAPINLPAGSGVKFTIQCGFNTMDRNVSTTWGENTADEMCLNFLYITSPLLTQIKDLGGL